MTNTEKWLGGSLVLVVIVGGILLLSKPTSPKTIPYTSVWIDATELRTLYKASTFGGISISVQPKNFPTTNVLIQVSCYSLGGAPIQTSTLITQAGITPLIPLLGWDSKWDQDLTKPTTTTTSPTQLSDLLDKYIGTQVAYFQLVPEVFRKDPTYFSILIIAEDMNKQPLQSPYPIDRLFHIDPIPPGSRY